MTERTRLDLVALLDGRRLSGCQWLTLALCFAVVFVDGFDTAVVGFVAPALGRAWHVQPSDLKQLLTVGFFGLAVGALSSGPLADRIGRKLVVIGAIVVFGAFSLLSATASSLGEMTLLRFLTGMGLGAAMPNATTLVAEYCPARHRSFLVTLMYSGFTLGSAGGGFIAAALLPRYGWPGVFVVGGVAPLVLAVVLAAALPESLQFLALRGQPAQRRIGAILRRIDPGLPGPDTATYIMPASVPTARNPVGALLEQNLRFGTTSLWLAFFMGLVVIYFVTSWLPTLITAAGLPVEEAAVIGAMFQVGGTLGALAVSWVMDRYDPRVAIAGSYALGAVVLLAVSRLPGNEAALGFGLFLAGFFMSGSQSSMLPLAAAFYPTPVRSTGVSWMLGVGRFGAILGAFAGGVLLSLGWGLDMIMAWLALPTVIAAIAVGGMRRTRWLPVGRAAAGHLPP